MITYGQKIVFGVAPPLPLRGFPEGLARIRLRNTDFAKISIRPPHGGVHRFYIEEHDGAWWPAFQMGANINQPKVTP